MSHLVSVKLSKEARKTRNPAIAAGREEFPFGLRIRLDKDILKKLGMKVTGFKVGEEFSLEAYARVTSTRLSEGADFDSSEVELQIEDLAVKKRDKSIRAAVERGVKDAEVV